MLVSRKVARANGDWVVSTPGQVMGAYSSLGVTLASGNGLLSWGYSVNIVLIIIGRGRPRRHADHPSLPSQRHSHIGVRFALS
jgi:hypothetical protein